MIGGFLSGYLRIYDLVSMEKKVWVYVYMYVWVCEMLKCISVRVE